MIPKIIHYCWFSGDKKPERIEEFIESWRKIMPDYKIKCWDANSFDFNSIPFIKDAYSKKKWAFVSDYIRLYAVYTEGGIYLDSDVMVLKRFDDFLNDKLFIGLECNTFYPQAAIFGGIKGNPILKDAMSFYENLTEPLTHDVIRRVSKEPEGKNIFDAAGNIQLAIAPAVFLHSLEKYGFKQENIKQVLEYVTIYPVPLFVDLDSQLCNVSTYAIHNITLSWVHPLYRDSKNIKGKLYCFCRKYKLYDEYTYIISVKQKIMRLFNKLLVYML